MFGDNEEKFHFCAPKLSALKGYVYEFGYVAAEMLFDALEGRAPVSKDIAMPWMLIERESSQLGAFW